MSNSQAVIDWRKRTKQRIVDAMGGKCVECDYDACISALELHHLNPTEKLFSFGSIRARPRAWKSIVMELKKCIMVCSNCHREIETGIRVTHKKSSFDKEYEEYTDLGKYSHLETMYKFKVKCVNCKTEFNAYRKSCKYCSEKCRRMKKQDRVKRKYR